MLEHFQRYNYRGFLRHFRDFCFNCGERVINISHLIKRTFKKFRAHNKVI